MNAVAMMLATLTDTLEEALPESEHPARSGYSVVVPTGTLSGRPIRDEAARAGARKPQGLCRSRPVRGRSPEVPQASRLARLRVLTLKSNHAWPRPATSRCRSPRRSVVVDNVFEKDEQRAEAR